MTSSRRMGSGPSRAAAGPTNTPCVAATVTSGAARGGAGAGPPPRPCRPVLIMSSTTERRQAGHRTDQLLGGHRRAGEPALAHHRHRQAEQRRVMLGELDRAQIRGDDHPRARRPRPHRRRPAPGPRSTWPPARRRPPPPHCCADRPRPAGRRRRRRSHRRRCASPAPARRGCAGPDGRSPDRGRRRRTGRAAAPAGVQ